MSFSTYPAQRKPINTRWILPSEGIYIAHDVKSEQSKYILFLSKILTTKPIKEAFVLLNKQNPMQRLKAHPDIRFGRSDDAIWFAPCDDNGHLLTITPLAAIFFKQDSIVH
jgi:hypothetical protein